jgi:hypothetical protein
MAQASREGQKIIMDLVNLNTYNAEGCAACGRKFELGETAVVACGAWEGGPKLVHENEAVFDPQTGGYIEKRCFASRTA